MSNVLAFVPRPITLAGDTVTLATQWLQELALLNYASSTIEARKTDLQQFIGFCVQRDVTLVQHITPALIKDFILSLLAGEKNSPRTAARKLDSVRMFLKFCVSRGLIKRNPADDVAAPRFTPGRVIAPDESAILKIIAGIPDDCPRGIRDNALYTLAYDSALRISALCDLDVHDPDNPPRAAVRPNGLIDYVAKGGRLKQSFCDKHTMRALDRWLAVRHHFARPDSPPALFLSNRGQRINRASVLANLKKYAKAAGVDHITAHHLRHARARQVIENAGLRAASSLLGHVNPTVTQNVYGHQAAERTRHQVRTLCPIDWEPDHG